MLQWLHWLSKGWHSHLHQLLPFQRHTTSHGPKAILSSTCLRLEPSWCAVSQGWCCHALLCCASMWRWSSSFSSYTHVYIFSGTMSQSRYLVQTPLSLELHSLQSHDIFRFSFFYSLYNYSLGCGASCDSSAILAWKHRCMWCATEPSWWEFCSKKKDNVLLSVVWAK